MQQQKPGNRPTQNVLPTASRSVNVLGIASDVDVLAIDFVPRWYRFNRLGRARAWLRQAQDHWRHHRRGVRSPMRWLVAVLAPEVAFYAPYIPIYASTLKGS